MSPAGNVYSQFGEDRIIADLLASLPNRDGWCVEFGAWDGRHFSNTFHLIESSGYQGVMIEAQEDRVAVLRELSAKHTNLYPIHRTVDWRGKNRLDNILREIPIPNDFDLVSIDIDGNDYHVWDAMTDYRPKLVVIEYNPTIPNEVEFIQEPKHTIQQGSSAKSLTILGHQKGYELVAVTTCNVIFVDSKYRPYFPRIDSRLGSIRVDFPAVTWIFSGYDGTTHLAGAKWLPWHDAPMSEYRVRQVPRIFQAFPDGMGYLRSMSFRLWRAYRRFVSH